MSGSVSLDASVDNSMVSFVDDELIEQSANNNKATPTIYAIPNAASAVCLLWSNHQSHLSDVVRELLEQECMVDATIVAGGEKILAHRLVLSACSDFFQELLSHVNEENTTIILDDVSAEDVKAIIEFCYNGEVRIPVEKINNLLEAAQLLKIGGLMEIDSLDENEIACEDELMDDDSNFLNLSNLEESDDKKDQLEEDIIIFNKEKTVSRKKKKSSQQIQDIDIKPKATKKSVPKKEYSDEQLTGAIEDLKKGKQLSEVASNFGIPRSTLYLKAKSVGVALSAQRCEYTADDMRGAIDAVIGGSSLQQASDSFGVPKTVLWRRIQKEGCATLRADTRKSYGAEKREAAKRALQRGDSLTKVAHDFQIPKTTLFRDKVRLVDEGKLPETYWRKRKTYTEGQKLSLLEEAVAACKEGKMSQAAASMKYKIPKTTIWRRLQKNLKKENSETNKLEQTKEQSSVMDLDDNPDLEDDFEAYNADDSEMMQFIECKSNMDDNGVIILEDHEITEEGDDDNFISCGLDLGEAEFDHEKS